VRELAPQVLLDVLGVEGLERLVARRLKEDRNRHDLAGMQPGRPQPRAGARGQQLLLPELIHRTEQAEYTHDDHLRALGTTVRGL